MTDKTNISIAKPISVSDADGGWMDELSREGLGGVTESHQKK